MVSRWSSLHRLLKPPSAAAGPPPTSGSGDHLITEAVTGAEQQHGFGREVVGGDSLARAHACLTGHHHHERLIVKRQRGPRPAPSNGRQTSTASSSALHQRSRSRVV